MTVAEICEKAKSMANNFTSVSTEVKNHILSEIKEAILSHKNDILRNNALDVAMATENGKGKAFVDRLTLTDARIQIMCDGLDAVKALPDYVGKVEEEYTLKNGLFVQRVHAPLGVIGIIYEARPNVTIDASALCIKASNGVVLRGSKDALNSNRYLAQIMNEVLDKYGYDGLIGFIDGADRSFSQEMLEQEKHIDVIIPRGGEALKKFVLTYAKMPVIASAGGNCHTYVESSADRKMAIEVILNAKLSRPSTCNALETVLCDRAIAEEFLPVCLKALSDNGVEIRGTEEVKAIYSDTITIDDDEFYVEYIDYKVKVKIVANIDEAIAHINKYGTNHSDAIITRDEEKAKRFTSEVDSAAVYVNASTRFTDGFELGLGAEMGISTQKLHVRGPIGTRELTSVKFVVKGNGQLR